MAEEQKQHEKDSRAFFEGMPCADMMRKMMEGKKEGQASIFSFLDQPTLLSWPVPFPKHIESPSRILEGRQLNTCGASRNPGNKSYPAKGSRAEFTHDKPFRYRIKHC
jgi:hypothetical protein